MTSTPDVVAPATAHDHPRSSVGAAVRVRHERTRIERWARTAAACGVLAMAVYTVGSAASLPTSQEVIIVIDLAIFPEPPGHTGAINLGPLAGLSYPGSAS